MRIDVTVDGARGTGQPTSVPQVSGRVRLMVVSGLAIGVLAAAIALVVSLVLPKTYEAEARVLICSLTEADPAILAACQTNAGTYAGNAKNVPILQKVIDAEDLSTTPNQLADQIQATAPQGIRTVQIVAQASTASTAARTANALASEVVKMATPSAQPSAAPTTPTTGQMSASVVQPAQPPTSASSPRILINTLVAGALGVVLGVGLGWLFGTRSTEL